MGALAGKAVLVTGAAGGIGAAVAVEVARQGASTVALTDRSAAALARTVADVEQAGATAVTAVADLEDHASVPGLVDEVVGAAGRIDVLVNAAGIHERALAAETAVDTLTYELWQQVLAVNLTAPWLLTRAVAPVMRAAGGGSIVNVSSQLGLVASAASPAYNASKAALIQLTRSTALDLAADRIRCNCVAPGAVETAMTDQIFAATADPAASRAAAETTYMLKRFGVTAEVAAAVCFLASEASSWTTGACLVVDGGQTAWR